MENSTQQENTWEARYQAGTTGWDRGKTSQNLLAWLDSGELQACRILVPGCGNGYEVLTLAERGFETVAIDIAATPVQHLQHALKTYDLTAEIIHKDFFAVDFSTQPFDAIYEQTCLCALPPSLWEAFEQWLYHSLKTGGKLYTHFMQTHQDGGPPFHCNMTQMKALFSHERWQWRKEAEPKEMVALGNKEEIPCLLQKQ